MDQPPNFGWSGRTSLPENAGGGPSEEESSGLKLTAEDFGFIFFRHKWKIIGCSLAGLVAAVAIYLFTPKAYRSDAMILVKYVPEREQALGPTEAGGRPQTTTLRGEAVLSSEIELLSSADLAKSVAQSLGPDRILAALGGGSDLEAAAQVVRKGIVPTLAGGNVISVSFQHPDPTIVQPALSKLVEAYQTEHYRVHRELSDIGGFEQKQATAQDELKAVERQLAELQTTNSIYSLEEAQKSTAAQISRMEDELNAAEADLAQAKAGLALLQQHGNVEASDTRPKDEADRREDYIQLCKDLEAARVQFRALTTTFTAGSAMVKSVQEQIATLEKKKRAIEKADPTIALSVPVAGSTIDPFAEQVSIARLVSKIATLTNQLEAARSEEARVFKIGQQILQLQKRKSVLDNKNAYFETTLAEARWDADLGASRTSGLNVIQHPTPPERVVKSLFKHMALAVVAGVALGLGLAMLLELFLDRTIKRPAELGRLLPVPVYMVLPHQKGKPVRRIGGGAKRRLLLTDSSSQAATEPELPETDAQLQPYFEALRDRILNRFVTLTRKPKLVGVCGCGENGEASHTAAGLAAALSESGDLKVLLVDVKHAARGRNPVFSTNRACNLLDALKHEKREEGLVAPNLYLATGEGPSGQHLVSSPSKFNKIVPQLNASDYDYIVFDMPVVDPVSVTPALAHHMDLTLMVVEAEKDPRNKVKEAGSLLAEFTSSVAVILNNVESDLPKWLQKAS